MRWGWQHPVSRPVATIVFLATVLALAAWSLPLQDLLLEFLSWIRSLGWRGVGIFLVVYTVAVILLLPSSVLTIAAGVIFGGVRGFAISVIASMAGAAISFLLAKFSSEGWRTRLRRREHFRVLEQAAREDGMRFVILMRLSPLFPFAIINYAMGLARVRTRDYMIGTFIGIIPSILLYIFLGTAAKNLAAVISTGDTDPGPAQYAFYTGLLLTISATGALAWWARRRLFQKLEEEEEGLRLSGEIPIVD